MNAKKIELRLNFFFFEVDTFYRLLFEFRIIKF